MNSLTRVIPFAGAFLLTGAMVGCGDDDGPSNPIDASSTDAPLADGGTPDACVGGHGEGCVGSPFALPEHGEFRLEVFQTGPSGRGNDQRVAAQAFFHTGQNPPIRPFGGKNIPIRPELSAQGYFCADYREGIYFDNGGTPQAQAVADSRAYIDVGANATLTNVENENDVITLAKYESTDDPQAATDISGNVVHKILYQADGDSTEVSFATQYKPAVAGSGTYLGLDLGFGEAAQTVPPDLEGDPLIFMPSDFQITQPAEADYFAEEGLTFTKGEDFELKYTIDEPEDFAGGHPTMIVFVGFVKNREVQAYCGRIVPGVLDDGTFVVPYEVFEVVDQDPAADEEGSYFELGRFTHTAWEAQNLAQPGRMDLLGINCMLSPDWVINPAPVQ